MKKNELMQIKGLDVKELKEKAKALTKEIANLVMDKNMKKIKDLKSVAKLRKDLAQVLTVIKQKELLGQLESSMDQVSKVEEVKTSSSVGTKVSKVPETKVKRGDKK